MKKIIMILILITLILSGCVTNNNAPSKALEVYPINYSEGIPLKITLKWQGYDEEDGSNLNYDVHVGKCKDNMSLIEDQITKNECQVLGLEPTTTYYWKIDSIDSKGAKREGEIWEFTTRENTPPTTPEIIEPENGGTNVSLNPTLKWKSIDIDGHKITYDIYIGADKNSLKLIEKDYEESTYKIEGLTPITAYYWKIIAKDGYGGIIEGDVWEFKTKENTPPTKPKIIEPYNGAKNVSLTPILKWKSEDIDGHKIIYDIYFGNDKNNLKLIEKDYKETTYKIRKLELGITYYWKIIAKDGYGGIAEGEIWEFTTSLLKWKYKTGGDVFSSPAIGSDRTIYIGSWDNYVYAINGDGTLKLKYKTEWDVSSSPVIGSDGTIYVGSRDYYLYATNENNGGLADTP
ncbi:hypothetical protein X275_00740 [Marinitoga sp. 1197]|uniref:PQQ-binding-like beta-propeller repeat protein n=1 Tax=Marinitoga sp. 1197 TaxID=1428449 RepID=UPI000658F20E|nr:PQQ-binding-like beta-propeller repeat protein [Marinitoga sp. 1197]KLO24244.1 hypothetical protein X275_00740 [Marinitoga sp. 1197]